jgi:hypothetical protein
MFAEKLWTEIMVRVVLITAVLCNALAATPAAAMSITEDQAEDSAMPLADVQGTWESLGKSHSASLRSGIVLQDSTAVATPQATETSTSTPEPGLPPTDIPVIGSPTTVETPTTTSETTAALSPAASEAATPVPTMATSQPPALNFHISASPDQAGPGDEVTFTVEIVNQ